MGVIILLLFLVTSLTGIEGNVDQLQVLLDRNFNVTTETKAVQDLLQRLLPDHAHQFTVNINSSINRDTVSVECPGSESGGVFVSAGGAVAASYGILHYLKYFCECHISWDADQLNLPSTLPAASFTITAKDKVRYYQNVCTVSYSSVWWQWPRWEREIDWMALNGVNLPLAFTGQEAVWRRVYLRLGLTEQEIEEHFAGPAYLAWYRMGNMMTFGGPLSISWHNAREILQKKILNRMREFGMKPVLPCFAGHVPYALQRVYPDAVLIRQSRWNNFNDTYSRSYMLDTTDPLFKTIGAAFITEMEKTYNYTHGFYNCDPFNEQAIPSSPHELRSVGEAIYGGITEADPSAIWVLQGWTFHNEQWTNETAQALLTSAPIGRILVLDLSAGNNPVYKNLESFYGQPFVFCMLHNFGGITKLYGYAAKLSQHLMEARSGNNSLVGTGLSMEGINQNYVIYDFMLETAWQDPPSDLKEWGANYSVRRYGGPEAKTAWRCLMNEIYAHVGMSYGAQSLIIKRPTITAEEIYYPMADLLTTFELLIQIVNSSSDYAKQVQGMAYKTTNGGLQQFFKGGSHDYNRDLREDSLDYNEDLREDSHDYNHVFPDDSHDYNHVFPANSHDYNHVFPDDSHDYNHVFHDVEAPSTSLDDPPHNPEDHEDLLGNEVVDLQLLDRHREQYKSKESKSKSSLSSVTKEATFLHDLVDVTREVIEHVASYVALDMIEAYKNGSYSGVMSNAIFLLQSMQDFDDILATSPNFLLGRWTSAAQQWGTSQQEIDQYTFNALMQISQWGPYPQGPLDYAVKEWSGVVSNYFIPRWQVFISYLLESLSSGTSYNETEIREMILKEAEDPFAYDVRRQYPTEPKGDTLQAAMKVYNTYMPYLKEKGFYIPDNDCSK